MTDNVLFSFIIAGLFLSLATLYRHALHIFQLNTYRAREQFSWLRANSGGEIGRVLGYFFALILVVLAGRPGQILACVLLLFSCWCNRPGPAKKPLVYTPRVRRLMLTLLFFFVVALAACLFVDLPLRLTLVLLMLFGPLMWPIMLVANILNSPVEKAINAGYIASARRKLCCRPNLKVIGITGSYGKTSVKHFLTHLLEAKYNVLMTPGNINTTLGVVRVVREQLEPKHQVFVCEMGARYVGDIKKICDLVHPTSGIITAVGPQHLETFKTVERVGQTKFELADAVLPDGKLYLNLDNDYIEQHPLCADAITYGTKEEADFRAYDMCLSPEGSTFSVCLPNKESVQFSTRLLGEHQVQNLAAAIAVAYHMGVDTIDLRAKVAQIQPVEHRLQLIKTPQAIVIDDAYNANPQGARIALETLMGFDGVRILITPGMIELGQRHEIENRAFGRQAARCADHIFLIGARQTRPIREGVLEAGFDARHLHIVADVKEALRQAYGMRTGNRQKVILIENDLPDQY